LLVAPRALTVTGDPTYRAGLGTMLVDLRRTGLPPSGMVRVRVEGGVRRTIVALRASRCVYVELVYDVRPLLANLAAQFTSQQPYSQVDLFGQPLARRSGVVETNRFPGLSTSTQTVPQVTPEEPHPAIGIMPSHAQL
jgi:hypothetical protein